MPELVVSDLSFANFADTKVDASHLDVHAADS
jgi:hypothetical protein